MPAATPQPQAGARVDPFRAYNFKLEVQGVQQGHFTECSGLGVKIFPIKYREGGEHQIIHAIPGPVEYADITLRYGLTSSAEMWDWLKDTMQGKVERKEVAGIGRTTHLGIHSNYLEEKRDSNHARVGSG